MMTWTCLCARYGKEAMLADVNPYYILGSVCACVWMIMLCVSVWSSCVCVCVCVCVGGWLVVCVCVVSCVCVCVCVQATGHRPQAQATGTGCTLLCSALLCPALARSFENLSLKIDRFKTTMKRPLSYQLWLFYWAVV